MKHTGKILLIWFLVIVFADAQEKSVKGKITYISGDALYTSLGKDAGITDSSVCYVISGGDTLASLKVLATSSKSSACTILTKKRPLVAGDMVFASIRLRTTITNKQPLKARDTVSSAPSIVSTVPGQEQNPPFLTVAGRIGLQYFATLQSNPGTNLSQPGMVLNLRGKFNELPFRFELYGNFRSMMYSDVPPGGSTSVNQTRIYRASLDYDDGNNRVSIGRVIPPSGQSIGYIDGGVITRRLGDLTLGAAGGFEPSFTLQRPTTDLKKFSVFTSYHYQGGLQYSGSLAYARTYFHSELDREVVSSSIYLMPSSDISMIAQGDIDLRSKKNDALVRNAQFTNLFANMNYRLSRLISMGIGISGWRPTYSFSTVNAVPDSFMDSKFRTSASMSMNLFLPGGVSVYDTYSPRSADDGFGKEYSNFTSVTIANLFEQGIMIRGSMSVNATLMNTSRGYGAGMQKSFDRVGSINVRYQSYQYVVSLSGERPSSKSVTLDFMTSFITDFSLWGSFERFLGIDANASNLSAEMSWSF